MSDGFNLSATRRGMSPWLVFLSLGMAGLALLVGVMIAVFPVGFTARFAAVILFLMAGAVALSMPRAQSASAPLLKTLMLATIVIVAFWPNYVVFKAAGFPGVSPPKIIHGLLLVCWLWWFAVSPPFRRRFTERINRYRGVSVVLMVFLAWRFVTALPADFPFASLWHFAVEALGNYVLFFVALSVVDDEADVHRLLIVLTGLAVALSLIALVEYRLERNLFARWLAMDPERMEQLRYIYEERWRGGRYRTQATFTHPLSLAEFLVCTLPFALLFASRAKGWLRLGGLAGVPVILLGIWTTNTRSALIGSGIVVLAFLGFVAVRQIRHRGISVGGAVTMVLLPFMVAGAVLFGIAATNLATGNSREDAGSTRARIIQLQVAGPLVADSPVVGYGPGMLGPAMEKRAKSFMVLDNFYLSLALESGIPALILFVFSLGYACWLGFSRAVRALDPTSDRAFALALAIFSFMLIQTILSLFENLFWLALHLALLIVVLEGARPRDGGAIQGMRRDGVPAGAATRIA